MENIVFVIRRNDDDFVVFGENDTVGYNVVPKSVDPCNAYDIDEVRLWCERNFDNVMDYSSGEIVVPEDITAYRDFVKAIEEDVRFLQDTDDVAFQLARHERGTQILSKGKLEDCLAKDRKRGEISGGLKQKRAEAEDMLGMLQCRYGQALRIVFGV
ncbi:MAG: hypothetical protein J5800_04610 [Spirochaetales bacterium]|nr:hypothetical protein [Spirochaetales bacterium]